MSEWCHNRLEITGKSVCIDVMLQWINGTDVPRHRHAVQQSIQLFLAGAPAEGCHPRCGNHQSRGPALSPVRSGRAEMGEYSRPGT